MTWSHNRPMAWADRDRAASVASAGRLSDRTDSALDEFLLRLPRQRLSADGAGQPLYLLGWDVVVAPYRRTRPVWQCVVLPSSRGGITGATVLCHDLDIETALPVTLSDPVTDLPSATFAAAWQAKALLLRSDRRLATVCHALAEDLREPHSRCVRLSGTATRQLTQRTQVHRTGLRRLLDLLREADLLHPAGPDSGAGRYILTLPQTATNTRARSEDGSWFVDNGRYPSSGSGNDTRM